MTPKKQIDTLKQAALALLGATAVGVTLFWGGTDPVTGYPDPITVDGETIEFTWTDENTDETLHIYTDKQVYSDGLTNADVYVAVVNTTSVWQNVELNGYFENQRRYFGTAAVLTVVDWAEPEPTSTCLTYNKKTYDRLVSQRKVADNDIVTEVASSTTYEVCAQTETINTYKTKEWLELPLTPRDLFEVAKEQDYLALEGVSKKQVENFIAEYKTFAFPIGPGQTIYYKLNINYPANDAGNFYLEAIGDRGGYGHLDPWFDAAWGYRVAIEVNPSYVSGSSNLTSFPVFLDLSDLPAGFHTNVKSDGCDIRVVESDETTETPFELVYYDSTGDTGELHFLADSLSYTATSTFYVYYGNSGASCYGTAATYGRDAVWSNYYAVWHFNEDPTGSAPQIADSTGNGNDITSNNMAADDLVTGGVGKAWDFDGTNDYGSVAGTPSNFQATQVSATQVAKKTSITGAYQGQTFYLSDASSPYNKFSMTIAGDLYFRTSASVVPQVTGTTQASSDTWVHNAVTVENGGQKVYLNGADNGSETGSYNLTGMSGVDSATFASQPYNGSVTYNDNFVSEYRFIKSILTADWITTESNNLLTPTPFYWVGDEESNGGGAARRVLFIQ